MIILVRFPKAVLLLLAAFLTGPAVAGAEIRNVLLLFSDDQRADTIGAYGNPYIQTPNLDQLVRSGFSFRNAYCMGSTQGAVCLPSRAMLMSGRTLFRVKPDLSGVPIMPEVLRQQGFITFGTGKWHNQRDSFQRGFTHGKNVFFGGMADHFNTPVVDLEEGEFADRGMGRKFSSEMFADATVDFLATYGKGGQDKPFFAYVAFTAPHDPRMPPQDAVAPYYRNRPPLPPNFLPQHPFDNSVLVIRDEELAAWPRQADVIRDQLAEYYGMIAHMDRQIGRIVKALDDAGLKESTLIVFASDHGLAMGSHGLLGKQNLYEHSMKAPLVFAGPGIPSNQSSDALAYLYDIFPTIMGQLGLKAPDSVEGKDLSPVARGERSGVRETLFTAYADYMRGVRDAQWKLIRYPQIDKTQLFDLARDPHELNDLSSHERYAPRIDQLNAHLDGWQTRVGDDLELRSANPKEEAVDMTGRKRTPDRHQPAWIVEKYFAE